MEHENLWVCDRCLCAIECHEGRQATFAHYVDEGDDTKCDWCGDGDCNVLYELV